MAFKPKSMAFPNKLTPNGPHQWKKFIKFWSFGFWTLDFGFGIQNFVCPFKVFLRSLVSKKSNGVKKSYVWALFYHKALPKVIGHFKSLCNIRWACEYANSLTHIDEAVIEIDSQLLSQANPYLWRKSFPEGQIHFSR